MAGRNGILINNDIHNPEKSLHLAYLSYFNESERANTEQVPSWRLIGWKSEGNSLSEMVWGRMNQKVCNIALQQRRKLWELPMKEIGTKGQGCTSRKTRPTPPSGASFVNLIFLQNIFQKNVFLIHGIYMYLAVLFHGGMQIYLHTTHCWSQQYTGVEQDVNLVSSFPQFLEWILWIWILLKAQLFSFPCPRNDERYISLQKTDCSTKELPCKWNSLSGALYLELITISSFFLFSFCVKGNCR